MPTYKFRVVDTSVQQAEDGTPLYTYLLAPDPMGDEEARLTHVEIPHGVIYLKARKSLKLLRGSWQHIEITPGA